MLRLSANLGFLWNDRPHPERIRAAKAAGFDAVECHFPYDEPAEEIVAALAETGLTMLALNTRPGNTAAGELGLTAIPGRKPDARAVIEEASRYAAAIGAKKVHVMAGRPSQGQLRAAHKTYVDNLRFAAETCAAAGQTVLIEPLNPHDAPGYLLASLDDAELVIAEVGAPNVKIMFDCYHVQLIHGSVTKRAEEFLGKGLVGHVQFAGVPDRGEPDRGELAYDRLLPAIAALGYDGYFGAEYRPSGKVEDTLGWMAALKG